MRKLANICALSSIFAFATQIRVMAWRSSGSTNSELVHNLKKNGVFSSHRVESAMLAVDRGDYSRYAPYEDRPQTIGYHATISAPHMHAAALEYLKDHLVSGKRALDIGSGSGYLAACMALMVGQNGTVVGVEHIPQLVQLSKENVAKHHQALLDNGTLHLVEGDGRLGWPAKAPYNAIHVGAASAGVPKALTDQLAEGGRMMIPVERARGDQVSFDNVFMQIDKINGEIREKIVEYVIYVPLTSREKQLSGDRG